MTPGKLMFCEDCTLIGIPMPENNNTCGNCGSHNVTVFLPVSGLTKCAPDHAKSAVRKSSSVAKRSSKGRGR